MKHTALSLFIIVILISSACQDSMELPERPPFPTAPDGQINVVFYHNILPTEYGSQGEEAYRDSISAHFGPTRSIAFRRSATDRNRFTIEIPTITPDLPEIRSCWDYRGEVAQLNTGDWFLVDLEADEQIVGFFTAFDYGQECEPYWVPFP